MAKTIESLVQFYSDEALKQGNPELLVVASKLLEAKKLSEDANGPELVPSDRIATIRAELSQLVSPPENASTLESLDILRKRKQLQDKVIDALIESAPAAVDKVVDVAQVTISVRYAVAPLISEDTPLSDFILPKLSQLRAQADGEVTAQRVEQISERARGLFNKTFHGLIRATQDGTVKDFRNLSGDLIYTRNIGPVGIHLAKTILAPEPPIQQ